MPLGDFRSVFMPYVVSRQKDGRYLVLNREYLPLGQWRRDQKVEIVPVEFKGLTSKVAAAVSWKGDPDLSSIFLYNDGSIPAMKAYWGRVAKLMKLKVKDGDLTG